MENINFKSERISKTAVIIINKKITVVFPLFGAFEERKWSAGWSPVLIYPDTEIIEEGTVFKTEEHGHGENEFLWLVTKFQPEINLIQYLVSTPNRFWTITVKCSPFEENKTKAEITYSFTGLNDAGNEINRHSLERMYAHNLKDWEEELNYFLENGIMLHHK